MSSDSKYFYRRLNPDDVADQLLALARTLQDAGWAERGGFLIRDGQGQVCARTKWIPRAQWWAERPFWFNERQCAGVVHKRLCGERLTAMEKRVMDYLLQVAGTVEGDRP